MSNDQHYLTAIRQRLELLYEEHPNDAKLREHISDEVDWINDQLKPAIRTPDNASDIDDAALVKLVDGFSKALLEKLRLARVNGRSGWADDDWEMACKKGLARHVEKGDPRDVAAFCAFMWHHGWAATPIGTPDEVNSECSCQGDPNCPNPCGTPDNARGALECLRSIAEADDREPREPDDADWRFRFLEAKRAAQCALAALPPEQENSR